MEKQIKLESTNPYTEYKRVFKLLIYILINISHSIDFQIVFTSYEKNQRFMSSLKKTTWRLAMKFNNLLERLLRLHDMKNQLN